MNLVRNTLSRDKVPELLAAHHTKPVFTKLAGDDLVYAMQKKLISLTNELPASLNKNDIVNSLADITELLTEYRNVLHISDTELSKAMGNRRHEFGGYTQGYYLFLESSQPLPSLVASISK